MRLIPQEVRPIFVEFGFDFYDFSDVRDLGAVDDEFIDGFHGSSITHLRLFTEMVRGSDSLRNYADVDQLSRKLGQVGPPYTLQRFEERYTFFKD